MSYGVRVRAIKPGVRKLQMTRIEYQASSDDFDALWSIVNGRRASSTEIRVPVTSLIKVLIDHQKLSAKMEGRIQ